MLDSLSLSGRVVMITGGGSGIGLATARLLDQLGARLVLVGRNREALVAAISELKDNGHSAEPYDLFHLDGIPEFVKQVSEKVGPLSGLVHSAGAQSIRPLRLLSSKEAEDILGVNTIAAMMLAKGFRQKGTCTEPASIVFVSSVMGFLGAAGRAAYCASKGALQAAAKALAIELAPQKIRVNCVAPGFVDTPMLEQARAIVGEEQLRRIGELHPLGFGQSEDVGWAIAFLLSQASRWTTGATMVVDGGYSAQ